MGDKSGIEWTDATWNPVIGCSHASAGCANCYAESLAGTRLKNNPHYSQVTRVAADGRPRFNGVIVDREEALFQPLRWKKPRTIFVNSMGDLFHKNTPRDAIDKVHAVMTRAAWHHFLILTKRPEVAREYYSVEWFKRVARILMERRELLPIDREAWRQYQQGRAFSSITCGRWERRVLPNVGLGVSVENQATADERLYYLLDTPAAMRFVSYEPALGPVDFMRGNALVGNLTQRSLNWVIAGGESGPGARPAHPDWFRSVRDQCQEAGVPFFFKQWGWRYKTKSGRLLDGVEHNGRPEWFGNGRTTAPTAKRWESDGIARN